MAIQFFFQVKSSVPANRTRLKQFIPKIFKDHHGRAGNINFIFCSDEEVLLINKVHLQHNFFTDIITFDLSTTSKQTDADIYISVDRVKENALFFKKTIKSEMHRVIFHGCLHLCGYKDKTASASQEMRKAEDKYLQQYFKH